MNQMPTAVGRQASAVRVAVAMACVAFCLVPKDSPSAIGAPPADRPPSSGDKLRDYVPTPGVFPPSGAGIHLAGDVVVIDPLNRRGGMRRDGGYTSPPLHYFAMLPYGTVWYHGAPAELRDVPLGTHMHAQFLLPLKGEEETIPPLSEVQQRDSRNDAAPYNHAILLEDDFSFYARRDRSWRVVSLEQGIGVAPRLKINVEPVGPDIEGGLNKPCQFDVDGTTRIWQERRLVSIDDIQAGQTVQVNLTWSPGYEEGEYATTDVWLDEESRAASTELQRQRHLRYQRSRFVPGWVDEVENFDYGGGVLTLTIFGGMDPELYADLESAKHGVIQVTSAENTLRTWLYHQENAKPGKVLSWKRIENPPLGSSGIQLKLQLSELLQGFTPGRVVKVKKPGWIYVLLPHDEWVMSDDDRQRASKLRLP